MTAAEISMVIEEGVATITLNRPEAMNAFSDTMREELLECLQKLQDRDDAGSIVITGAGRAFCAGGDIASMAELQASNDTSVIAGRIDVAGKILAQIRSMQQPVIAAINGAAAGGGMNLALACDMRLAVDNAIFAQSFVKIGLVPDWGGFYSLTRLVGSAKAMEIMMTGDRFDAREALRLGLVNQIFSADEFGSAVRQLAQRIAKGPREAMAGIKQGIYLGLDGTPEDVLAFEQQTQKQVFLSADSREGMPAFLEKRPPVFNRPDRD